MFIQGMLHLVTVRATCVATKLRDKLQEKMPSVTAHLIECNVLSFSAYSHPYVISFSERAIDVFDSSSAEWLQTIPLKKVTMLKQIYKTYCCSLN